MYILVNVHGHKTILRVLNRGQIFKWKEDVI
jgi:hypothetical protein